jgi:hypothetical protein
LLVMLLNRNMLLVLMCLYRTLVHVAPSTQSTKILTCSNTRRCRLPPSSASWQPPRPPKQFTVDMPSHLAFLANGLLLGNREAWLGTLPRATRPLCANRRRRRRQPRRRWRWQRCGGDGGAGGDGADTPTCTDAAVCNTTTTTTDTTAAMAVAYVSATVDNGCRKVGGGAGDDDDDDDAPICISPTSIRPAVKSPAFRRLAGIQS